MTDNVDQAQAFEQMRRNHALQRHVMKPQTGTIICVDCDLKIPAQRRKAQPSARRCTFCQDQLETRSD